MTVETNPISSQYYVAVRIIKKDTFPSRNVFTDETYDCGGLWQVEDEADAKRVVKSLLDTGDVLVAKPRKAPHDYP